MKLIAQIPKGKAARKVFKPSWLLTQSQSSAVASVDHHIIPFALLRSVWNRLVERHVTTTLPVARVALRRYASLSDRNQPRIDDLIARMRAENTTQARANHHELLKLDPVVEAQSLQSAALWPAWNIVQGPKSRSDDPKDQYDRFTYGLPPGTVVRMNLVDDLYRSLRHFESLGPTPGADSLGILADALVRVRPLALCSAPVPFTSAMWIKQENGEWRKRHSADP